MPKLKKTRINWFQYFQRLSKIKWVQSFPFLRIGKKIESETIFLREQSCEKNKHLREKYDTRD